MFIIIIINTLCHSITAIDVLPSMQCTEAVADLMREADILASLRHPNIVSVYGVVLPEAEGYLAAGAGVGSWGEAGVGTYQGEEMDGMGEGGVG